MAGLFTRRAHVVQGAASPAATPNQYIVPSMLGGAPVFVNESSTADLDYLTPAGYVNEAP